MGHLVWGEINVEEGSIAILLINGSRHAILQPGRTRLNQFPRGDLSAYIIDVTERTLTFESNDGLFIQEVGRDGSTAPVEVRCELSVTYKISPQRASQIAIGSNPIQSICAFVQQALQDQIKYWSFDAFHTRSIQLGEQLRTRISKDIEQNFGIHIVRIIPTKLTGADRFRRAWEINVIESSEVVDDNWKIRNKPEIYIREQELRVQIMQQLSQLQHEKEIQSTDHSFQITQRLIEEYLKVGGDASSILNQPIGQSANNWLSKLFDPNFNKEDSVSSEDRAEKASDQSKSVARELSPSNKAEVSEDCVNREWDSLEEAGYTVTGRPGLKGARSIPDGTFTFLSIYTMCWMD